MESNRYFILQAADGVWIVNTYTDPTQAAYDFIRMGGLVTPDIIFAQECEVSLRLNNQKLSYEKGGKDEGNSKDGD